MNAISSSECVTFLSDFDALQYASIVMCAHLEDSDTASSSLCNRHLAPHTAVSLPLASL